METPECKYCNDEGYIHTCMNCHKPAIYDYEIGVAVCDYCFLSGEKHNVLSEKCTHCNIADQEIKVPKVGEKVQCPTEEQLNGIINWSYLIKIPNEDSYDIISPIKVDNNILEYYSYVENMKLQVDLSEIPEIEIKNRSLTSVKWSTNLKGLITYLKEERNKDLTKGKQFVRLVFFTGCSWDRTKFNQSDTVTKRNIKDAHFVNGLTLKIDTLTKGDISDSLYSDSKKNIIYLIESISKFEIL